MNQEEIFNTLRKEFKLDEKQTKLIIDSLWSGIRSYLTDPLNSKGRIILPKLGTFNISPYAVDKVIERIESKDIKRTRTIRNLEFYEELAETLKKNARQARKKTEHE